ncbi:MAG: aldose epimerase family protein [Sphingomicrobium sp.]
MTITRALPILAGAVLLAAANPAHAVTVQRTSFGKLSNGTQIDAVTLTNARGVSARIITWGATLQSLIAPDRAGRRADVALGFANAAAYEDHGSYFGASVGRFANRIADGRFSLDGKTYQLEKNNNGVTALHGGVKGFDKQVWKVLNVQAGPVASVTMGLTSPNGDQGYPGTLTVSVTYTLDEKNDLKVDYRARTDRPTIVNLTSHGLYNMAGEGSANDAMGNRLTIFADRFTPVDAKLIPTGVLAPVAGTPFDFRTPHLVKERARDARHPQIVLGRGYDHNYVLRGAAGVLRLAARLEDPASGRRMDILSDQPGIQLYSGNFIDGTTVGKSGKVYRMGDGIALEPQHFPDSPNKSAFASVRLDPGQEYRNVMVFRLGVSPR